MEARLSRSSGVRSGFTLVELLVVIGIIAVLISILLPALNKVRAAGMQTACLSNLRQIGQALNLYIAESKGQLPIAPYRDVNNQAVPIHVLLYARLNNNKPINDPNNSPFRCPAMRDNEANFSTSTSTFGRVIGTSEYNGVNYKFTTSYTITEGASYWRNATTIQFPAKITQIRRASEIAYAFDGRGTFRIDQSFTANPNNTPAIRTAIQGEIDDHLILRHGVKGPPPRTAFTNANVLYVDGHASTGGTGYSANNPGGLSPKNTDWRRQWN